MAGGGREELAELAGQEGVVDLIIPRGGEGLKKAISAVARVPVIYAAAGNCHVYVDASADLAMAERIIINAKVQRPGVCNAAETLLVHASVAADFLPGALASLRSHGVELRGDERVRAIDPAVAAARESDWGEEFLALVLAVRVVDSYTEAIDHINTYSSQHTDAIVTEDHDRAMRFLREVDSASVMVNASTRFADGFEFGLGAEIGISNDKLHARGPVGLEGLTSLKYVVLGHGEGRQ